MFEQISKLTWHFPFLTLEQGCGVLLLKEAIQYLHENSYKLKTNTISYNIDEIPDEKLFKICTAMPKWHF